MEIEVTADACLAPPPAPGRRIGRAVAVAMIPAAVLAVALLAWVVARDVPYGPGSRVGYGLGVAGGSLMLALLIYPLRKRFRGLAVLGPLKYWFRLHLVGGIAGPAIILFHTTFRVGSFNAAVALASMLLVVASGLVGRYLYRRIHHGLHGSRATAAELQGALARRMEALQPVLACLPALEREVGRFTALLSSPPPGRWARVVHFATLGWRRHAAKRRIGRAIGRNERKPGGNDVATRAHLRALAETIDDALQAAQRAAQFSTYERLFSLWHVIHIPFLVMLVVTAIVHVVAVHVY